MAGYIMCVMLISLEVWKFTHCVMLVSLRFTSSHAVYDDDKFGSLQVHMLCVMMVSLEVDRFTCCVR